MRRHTAIITAIVTVAVIVLIAVTALLTGEQDPDEQAQPPPPEPEPVTRLVAGLVGHPGHLDPHTNTEVHGRIVLEQVYDTLVRPGPQLRIQPALARDWEVSDDQRTWTFHLRDDVSFHDGATLTADDVVASLERVRDRGSESLRLDVVEDLSAPDDATVAIELRHPAADLPARLASSPRLGVVPAAAIEAEEVDAPLPGTGPFRPTRAPDDHGTVVLERFEDAWEQAPLVDRLDVIVVGGRRAGLAHLQAGEIHWLASLVEQDLEDAEADEALALGRVAGLDHWHLTLDTRQAPFDDVDVRRALGMALDRGAIADAVRPGAATVNQTAIPPGSWWHHDHAPFDHDPEAARAVLEDAGHDPLEFDLLATEEAPQSVAIAEEVADQLAEIDVEVTVRTAALEDLLSEIAAGEFDAYALGWSGGLDPDEVYWPTHHSDGERNYHGLADEETDELLEAAREEPDDQARAELYVQATERIVGQAGQLFLFNPDLLQAWSADLTGVALRADGLVRFDTVDIDGPPAADVPVPDDPDADADTG